MPRAYTCTKPSWVDRSPILPLVLKLSGPSGEPKKQAQNTNPDFHYSSPAIQVSFPSSPGRQVTHVRGCLLHVIQVSSVQKNSFSHSRVYLDMPLHLHRTIDTRPPGNRRPLQGNAAGEAFSRESVSDSLYPDMKDVGKLLVRHAAIIVRRTNELHQLLDLLRAQGPGCIRGLLWRGRAGTGNRDLPRSEACVPGNVLVPPPNRPE